MTETLAPTTPTATILVHEESINLCEARLEKLAVRATKLGCSISWEIGASEPKKVYDSHTGRVTHTYLVRPVTVTGSAPRLAGWAFIGLLSRSDAAGTLRKMVPGIACPDSAKDATPERCDQCHKARRRDRSFIVQHEDGRVNVVGSSCLADFLGHKSPEQVVNGCYWLTDVVDGLDEEFGFSSGGGGQRYFAPLEVLRVAFHLAANGGYRPAKFENKSTASEVFATLLPPIQAREAAEKLLAEITEATTEKARAAIEWAKNTTEDSDFMNNIRVVAGSEWVSTKSIGMTCAIVPAYDRDAIKRTEKAARPVSAHFGVVKERKPLGEATVLHIHSFETQYGWQCIYLFLLADGNVAKWKTSSDIENVGKGSQVIIKKATIKAHEEYQGTAQTVLTRVELELVPEAAEVAAA